MSCQAEHKDMELLAICLCIVLGRVSADPGRGVAAKGNVDVIVEVIDSMSPPRVDFDPAKVIAYPGQQLLPMVKDHKSQLSIAPGLPRSENAHVPETLGSPSRVLKHGNVMESSSWKTKNRSVVNSGTSGKRMNMLPKQSHDNISARFLRIIHGAMALRNPTEPTFGDRTRPQRKRRDEPSDSSDANKPPQPPIHIPDKLKAAMKASDFWEDKLLLEFVTLNNRTAVEQITSEYIAAQREERWLLKKFVDGLPEESEAEKLLTTYKKMRTGKASQAKQDEDIFSSFFKTTTNLLKEYNDLKDNELEVDGYLEGTIQYPNEEEFNKEMREKDEYRNLPKAVRNSKDLVKLARLRHEEEQLLPKVEGGFGPKKKKKKQQQQQQQQQLLPQNVGASANQPQANVVDNVPMIALEAEYAKTPPPKAPNGGGIEGGGGKSPMLQLSLSVMKTLLDRIPSALRQKMSETDKEEAKILEILRNGQSAPREMTDAYKAKQKEERLLLRQVLQETGTYSPQTLDVYKAIRKGDAWTHVKLDDANRDFFQNPSKALAEYEILKRSEFDSLDAFLLEPNSPVQNAETEEIHRKTRAEDEERSRIAEDEKRESETEKDSLTNETTEEMVSVEASEDVNETTQEVNGTDDVLESPDNLTSSDALRIKNTADRKKKETSRMIRIGIVLSVPINVVLALVILGLYRKDIKEWYRLRKISKAILADGEREHLHSGRMVSSV